MYTAFEAEDAFECPGEIVTTTSANWFSVFEVSP